MPFLAVLLKTRCPFIILWGCGLVIRFVLIAVVLFSLYRLFIKRRSYKESSSSRAALEALPSSAKSAFLVCVFSMLAKIVASDGEIGDEELRRVEAYIDEELSLSGRLKELAKEVFQSALKDDLELRDYALRFREEHKDRVALFSSIIRLLIEIAAVDSYLSPDEDRQIRSAAILFGISEAGYEGEKKRLGVRSAMVH